MVGFEEFFRALWDHEPFPWQAMLADRVVQAGWPPLIDLPTAAGKTACIEIALFALAAQADRDIARRTAPRRVWFVVDRRIVVDEAFNRANRVAEKLAEATRGPLKNVADRLRHLSGTDRPLAVARLRGGVLRDDGWARLPSQPAVITSTVDQLGSRLLFRGYGHSLQTAPIFAGLAANDSLILLDEAHCAIPFLQTLQAVERLRGEAWAEQSIYTPFAFVCLSATPRAGPHNVFPSTTEREAALAHPKLQRRLQTPKPAELVELKPSKNGVDPLVAEAAQRASRYAQQFPRVAIMVNRVATAAHIADQLSKALAQEAHVVLLTGRMRPYERDRLVEGWSRYLRASAPEPPPRPVIVVSTQCLEVGADFSFDALVTECASLDALRQRFGRLARMGLDQGQHAPACILMRASEIENDDPVYGRAIGHTWNWLNDRAMDRDGRRIVDFGFAKLDASVRDTEDLGQLLAPACDAPLLLPAHLDLLCQTAPPAQPEPDVSLYLHGRHGPPEVQVVWRCDLSPQQVDTWKETIALCPPVSAEMLSVPLGRLREWLARDGGQDDASDVEGAGGEEDVRAHGIRRCLVWRGRDRSKVACHAQDIAPGDVVIIPADYGIDGLGQSAPAEALGESKRDLFEPARRAANLGTAVRLHRAVLAPWMQCPPVVELVKLAESPDWSRDALEEAIRSVRDYLPADEQSPPAPPDWWRTLLADAFTGRIVAHPAGGLILYARRRPSPAAEPDLFADDDDLLSVAERAVSLQVHSQSVEHHAQKFALLCLPQGLRPSVEQAAYWHDVGKLDERFQVMLHHGDELAAAAATDALAKSEDIPLSPSRRQAIRQASGLPANFRHEMLSVQLAERCAPLPEDPFARDLLLHLIASHHGHGRPFAPISEDPHPPTVEAVLENPRGDIHIAIDAETRKALPPHRLHVDTAERFWRLNRRYGWWGLAYLEAIFRLSDWYGSVYVLGDQA